ncbi:hypothetical protein, partial [Actinoplanes auranticolor]|uniref:hypothetical protein n=1 Tax=Actinoplanes auranticolor TaxID=47988 RepID=UPI001BB40426
MPKMLKFGYRSATSRVTSALGSRSRAASPALMPASLPPMTRSRTARPSSYGECDAGGSSDLDERGDEA